MKNDDKNTAEAFFRVLEEMQYNENKCPYDYEIDLEAGPQHIYYFEAIIGRDGKVYEAPAGHTKGMVNIIARERGITAKEVEDSADRIYYTESLQEMSGVILMWYEFYAGNPNERQLKTIELLKEKKFIAKNAFNRDEKYK